jgi:7,8-dihydropterin-6-yl-methyl-4-(beta-D-ribofuranosyl)aminobenzene 5'-phosphate synthase
MTEYAVTLRILMNDWTDSGPFLAEHGLAYWLDLTAGDQHYHLLFDTGQSAKALAHNAAALRVDWASLDAVVLSHGHHDHSGGLQEVLRQTGRRIPVILHPDALCPKLKLTPSLQQVGMPLGRDRLEEAACLLEAHEPLTVTPGVQTSGEIPRKTDFERVRGFLTLRQGRVEPDEMLDDQALFIHLPDAGLVIVTGCGHAGIINTVQHGLALTGATSLSAIVGGFHLNGAPPEQVAQTIARLQAFAPRLLVPLHCTGEVAIGEMARAFGPRVRRASVGDELRFQSGHPTAP